MVELERILIQKLRFAPQRWRGVEELLRDLAVDEAPMPAAPPHPVSGDPDDDLILACAVAADVEVLVSGDRRHLLPIGEHRGVRVITPQALLAELQRT
jgi:predicted nucleic acid-binding protein